MIKYWETDAICKSDEEVEKSNGEMKYCWQELQACCHNYKGANSTARWWDAEQPPQQNLSSISKDMYM